MLDIACGSGTCATPWGADFADLGLSAIPGAINLSVLGNYLDSWTVRTDTSQSTSLLTDYAGTNFSSGTFRWKLNTTLGYTVGPVSVDITWRHLPGVENYLKRAYYVQLAAFNAGVPRVTRPGLTNSWIVDAASHDEFDLSATWSLSRNAAGRCEQFV